MNDILIWLLGKKYLRIPEGARTELVWTDRPQSWAFFIMLAFIVTFLFGAWRFYKKEMTTCPPKWKKVLAAIRCTILIILALVFMGPALSVSIVRTVEPYVLVLLDDSLSMSVNDKYRNQEDARRYSKAMGIELEELQLSPPSRIDVMNHILQSNDNRLLKELAKHGKVRVFSFSSKVLLREALDDNHKDDGLEDNIERGAPAPPISAQGQFTSIARGLRDSLKSVAGTPVSAIIIFSDGQNTSGDDPEEYSKKLERLGVPVFTVGIGDASAPKNIRVSDIIAQENAFKGDPLTIEGTVDTKGMNGVTVELELVIRKVTDSGTSESQVVDQKSFSAYGESGKYPVTMKHTPKIPGKFSYSIRAVPRGDEFISTDNEKSTVVKVLDEKMKILLIAGSPSWDYRLVKNLLIREKTVNLSCWLQTMDQDMLQEGNSPIKRLPTKPDELYTYDAVMLFDPNPTEFNEAWIAALKTYMDQHAGGVLWAAGPIYSLKFLTLSRTKGIRSIIPVKFDNIESKILDATGSAKVKEWRVKVTPTGSDHPIMQIAKGVDIRETWANLPGVYWSFPSEKPKPGTQTLLTHTDPKLQEDGDDRPLLVTGQYGAGRSIYIGINSTWRWRRNDERYFDRFWINVVRYMLDGRISHGRSRGRLITDRERYSVGDRITFTATLYDAKFEPLKIEGFPAIITGENTKKTEINMKPIADRPGVYEGTSIANILGMNEVRAEINNGGNKPLVISRQFNVDIPNLEFADPRMNRELLQNIARLSKGKFFEIDQVDKIPSEIPNKKETLVVRERPRELWDTNRLLLLLVTLLTCEWALRKKFKLL